MKNKAWGLDTGYTLKESLYDIFGGMMATYHHLGAIEFFKVLLTLCGGAILVAMILWVFPSTRNIMIIIWNITLVAYHLILAFYNITCRFIELIFSGIQYVYFKISNLVYNERLKRNDLRYKKSSYEDYSEETSNEEKTYSNSDLLEYYLDLLNLTQLTTMSDLKKAFRDAMRQYHPDKVDGLGEEFKTLANEKSTELNNAYEFLKQRVS